MNVVIQQLLTLKQDFVSEQFHGASVAVFRDINGKIVLASFGLPGSKPENDICSVLPDGPVIESGLSTIVMLELHGLFNRAGNLLAQVPNRGVQHPEWRAAIDRESKGFYRWAAYLLTGPRLLLSQPNSTGNVWRIDDVARVTALAIDNLLAELADSESQPELEEPNPAELQLIRRIDEIVKAGEKRPKGYLRMMTTLTLILRGCCPAASLPDG